MVGTDGGATTVYIGNYFEWKGSTSTMVKYYYADGEREALFRGAVGSTMLYLGRRFGMGVLGSCSISLLLSFR